MTSARRQQIEALVEAALEYEPEERTDFLARACGTNLGLRREATELLESYQKADGFLAVPLMELPSWLAEQGGDSTDLLAGGKEAPDRLGPYRLLHRIGQGGMGEVFLAERQGDFERRVAIKVLGSDHPEPVDERRFRSERQILARLDHPGIARLLDGGTTPRGEPYLVMELVEGARIDRYCEDRDLSVEERIELFRKVCAAVHYAHQNLVVHRDIKPSNVLVTDDGEPKLLDFGIAELVAGEESAPADDLPEPHRRRMTPEYASPEQLRGEVIATTSDVYSLGVLLYRLLTGLLPHPTGGRTATEVESQILEADPLMPSLAVVRPSRIDAQNAGPRLAGKSRCARHLLGRRLRGDLDAILLKALEKQPERRYDSAAQLSEDLRRHLAGHPVQARRAALAYRAGKFLLRHRLAVAASVLLLVLLAGFASFSAFQATQIARQRDRAEEVLTFFVDLFQHAEPNRSQGEEISVREVLDRGASEIRRDLQDQPDRRATLLEAIGRTYRHLGLYEKATPLLEEVLAIRRQLPGGSRLEEASSLYELGLLKIAKERFDEAEVLLSRALEIRQEALPVDHPAVAEVLHALGRALQKQLRVSEARPLLQQAFEIRKKVLGNEHPDAAETLHLLAIALAQTGEVEQAEESFRRALEIRQRALGPEHTDVARTWEMLGVLYLSRGQLEQSEAHLLRALEIQENLLGADHPRLSGTLENLAALYFAQGNLLRQEQVCVRALAISERSLGRTSHTTLLNLHCLVSAHLGQGHDEDAAALFRRFDPALRELFAKPDIDPLERKVLGHLLLVKSTWEAQQGRREESRAILEQVVEWVRPALGNRESTLLHLYTLALLRLGRAEEAQPIVQELLTRNWSEREFLDLSRRHGLLPGAKEEVGPALGGSGRAGTEGGR